MFLYLTSQLSQDIDDGPSLIREFQPSIFVPTNFACCIRAWNHVSPNCSLLHLSILNVVSHKQAKAFSCWLNSDL